MSRSKQDIALVQSSRLQGRSIWASRAALVLTNLVLGFGRFGEAPRRLFFFSFSCFSASFSVFLIVFFIFSSFIVISSLLLRTSQVDNYLGLGFSKEVCVLRLISLLNARSHKASTGGVARGMWRHIKLRGGGANVESTGSSAWLRWFGSIGCVKSLVLSPHDRSSVFLEFSQVSCRNQPALAGFERWLAVKIGYLHQQFKNRGASWIGFDFDKFTQAVANRYTPTRKLSDPNTIWEATDGVPAHRLPHLTWSRPGPLRSVMSWANQPGSWPHNVVGRKAWSTKQGNPHSKDSS